MPESLPEGTVTLLFTDVEKSTDLRTSRGDETAHALLQTQADLVRAQIAEHGGHEVKSMGDGFMVAFASARSAVGCAVGIQRRLDADNRARPPEDHVRVRIGLNTGEVVRQDGDLFGEAVNAAARIMAKATGGQILVSETVRAVLGHGGDAELVDRGRFRMKGFPERWRLYEVLWRSKEEPAAAVAPVLAERTPFVGREEERAELRRLMEQAIAGHGSIVLIRGEPGVGKTRLAQELVLEARARGMVDRTGRCYEMEGAPPYIPFIEMLQQAILLTPAPALRLALGENAGEVAKILPELRRIYDDIPPPLELPPEQERMYLFNSMREFVERTSRIVPLLLVLDDLHWADDATLLLMQHVAQQQDQMAVLTVATYRDIELDAARPLARALESLLRQRLAHRIALKPLPQAAVEAMLQGLTGQPPPAALVQAIYKETEGNPFFVEEVFHHLLEQGKLLDAEGRWRPDLQVSELDVPEGVRLVISRRLERVSEECRTALTDASVVGRDFTFELLQALTDLDPDAILDAVDEAERANLIAAASEGPALAGAAPGEARFSFAHELIRQTLISGLSMPRRQRMHLRVAETMERVYGQNAEAHAADLAHHLYQAGAAADPAKTARYLVLAGDRALEGTAFGEALRDYDIAFSLQPAGERAARADLFYKRGLARRSLGRWEEALADWHQALALYEEVGDKTVIGSISSDIAEHLLWGGRYLEAVEISQRGLLRLGRQVSADRALLLGYVGLALSQGGYHTAGAAMLRRCTALSQRLSDKKLIGLALTAQAVHHYYYMRHREAVEVGLRGADILRSEGDLWNLANVLFFVHTCLSFLCRIDEANQIYEELEPLAARLGHLPALLSARSNDRNSAFLFGTTETMDGLERFCEESLEIALSHDLHGLAPLYQHWLGVILFWRGRWEEAMKMFQKASEVAFWERGAIGFRFLTRAYAGDRDGARSLLEQKTNSSMAVVPTRQRLAMMTRLIRSARSSGLSPLAFWRMGRVNRSATMEQALRRPGDLRRMDTWTMLFAVVEGWAVLGERVEAAKLYPLMLEAMKTGNVFRNFDARLLDTLAGIAAGANGKWPEAEEHFRAALRRAEELPHVIEQPEARRWYAWMLLDRNAPGDREKAHQLLTEAIEMYRRIGMPKHIEMAEALLVEAGGDRR